MNTEKLKAKVKECGYSQTQIAATCGLSVQGWYNKLSGVREFKVSEVAILSKALKLSPKERADIFLG